MNKKILYLECFSGISGDMTVAALLDLGADEGVLRSSLDSLNLQGYKIKIGRIKKCGIDACDFDVILGNNHVHDHDHEHNHEHNHDHHSEHHHHHEDSHEHRNINDIYKIIDESKISKRAKSISRKIFDIISKAEAKAHGIELDKVHFHEVGAIDSIVDIVSVAVLIDDLNIEEVVISDLYEGSGHVKCQHGIIPVPVPAVVNIVAENSLSLRLTDVSGEMVTPTGAAIAAALKTRETLPSSYKLVKIGIGAGKKNFANANILRAFIIEENHTTSSHDEMWVLETNLDDCTGENLGFTMEKLIENGANDVFYTAIHMKKNRPAYKLSVLCVQRDIKLIESIIFQNTTSIGIRRYKTQRTVLNREVVQVDTKYGLVRVKVSYYDGEKYYNPEYEDIKRICNGIGLGYKVVVEDVLREFNTL